MNNTEESIESLKEINAKLNKIADTIELQQLVDTMKNDILDLEQICKSAGLIIIKFSMSTLPESSLIMFQTDEKDPYVPKYIPAVIMATSNGTVLVEVDDEVYDWDEYIGMHNFVGWYKS